MSLGTLCKVIRVNTYAMASDQTGFERQEVPFSRCCLKYILSVNAQFVENLRKLIYESDIDISLRIFYNLCSLSHFDTGRHVRTGFNDRTVYIIDKPRYFRCRA